MGLTPLLLAAGFAAATASEPITAILEAFRSHAIVAYGERHGDEVGHRFRLQLIRDPRFAATVDDIVVECGNARYQETIDRFVRGDDVPDATLREVWRAPYGVWDHPIYAEFFRTVRAVNAREPRTRQLRVLLGDPPIDWTRPQSDAEVAAWYARRDHYPADLIAREVLAKQRRAFVVYGEAHVQKMDLSRDSLVDLLERGSATKVFTIATHPSVSLEAMQVDVRALQAPTLFLTTGTTLERQVNAVLYLGGGVHAQAQAHPNFSGTWTIADRDPSTPPPLPPPPPPPPPGADARLPPPPLPPPPPQTVAMKIEQTDTRLTIDRTMRSSAGVRDAVRTSVYALDGTESANQTGSITTKTTAAWDGSRLVLSSKHSIADNEVGTSTDVYTLTNDTLTIEHARRLLRGTASDKQVFVRSTAK